GGDKELPYSRPNLNNGVGAPNTLLTSESLLLRHDLGWWSVFHALSTPLHHKYDFGTAATVAPSGRSAAQAMIPLNFNSPANYYQEVMRVFLPGGTYTKHLSRGETTLEGFLERAAARLPGLTDAQGETIEKLV